MSETLDVRPEEFHELAYTIHSCSSYSGQFRPNNILVNRPKDPTSRWSGAVVTAGDAESTKPSRKDGSDPWVLLELAQPSVVGFIKIGKFHESHPCNPTSIRIMGGPDPKHLREIYSGKLTNDSQEEIKGLKWKVKMWNGDMGKLDALAENENAGSAGQIPFAVKYIKLQPGPSFEPRFNRSLWYVALQGNGNETMVTKIQQRYTKCMTLQANRLMLKHMRDNRMVDPYTSLLTYIKSDPNSPTHLLEHPLLTSLHTAIVENGDYDSAESLLGQIMSEGLMDHHIARMPTSFKLNKVESVLNVDGDKLEPKRRGGHSMCSSRKDGSVYVFGGWDGANELDDFWVRKPITSEEIERPHVGGSPWKQIVKKTSESLWPCARSGHVMASSGDKIYMMGAGNPRKHIIISQARPGAEAATAAEPSRSLVSEDLMEVVEQASPPSRDDEEASKLWAFDVNAEEWQVLNEESTAPSPEASNFFKQLKEGANITGLTVSDDGSAVLACATKDGFKVPILRKFDLSAKKWCEVSSPIAQVEAEVWDPASPSASGQAVCLHPSGSTLVSLGLSKPSATGTCTIQLWMFGLPPKPSAWLKDNSKRPPTIKAGQPIRGYLDEAKGEIVVVVGHELACVIPKAGKAPTAWRYNIALALWFQIHDATDYAYSHTESGRATPGEAGIPAGITNSSDLQKLLAAQRCGHELVHSSLNESVMLMGSQTPVTANSGNDYRIMTIQSPGADMVKRQCLVALRKQRFVEMVPRVPSMQALQYLQGPLHAVIDHNEPEESRHFRALLAHLLQFGGLNEDTPMVDSGDASQSELYEQRRAVFETLLRFVGTRFKQPTADLLTSGFGYDRSESNEL